MQSITYLIKLAGTILFLMVTSPTFANVPGGGTGTGANVTLTDNGTTVTLANGIVSIVCTKSGATINQINYTYNNGSGNTTLQLLNGGTDGGQLYWETGGFDATASGYFSTTTYSVVADPATTSGNYAEISMVSASPSNGVMEVHFSLLRGSQGFYVTPIWYHRSVDVAEGMGETRDNIYGGSIFNWMCVDGQRNRLMEVSGGTAIPVYGAPKEVSLWTNGIYAGRYEDKYKYSADLGVQRAWGWCSVGSGGKNVGLWNVSATAEYYNGGPMKRELMDHIGTTILNMLNGGHYGGGSDGSWAAGEIWTKVYGPYFIYCNNLSNTVTDETQASIALYADAQAQAAAEQPAWPYSWFTNANYTPAAGRGTITGTMVINDGGNPNASTANLWVGAVIQPSTTDGVHDFQEWMKPYQFWTKTDNYGNFTISNVIAAANYTLYAFGPGAPGTYLSQSQSGGNPPLTVNVASPAYSVTVTAGATNSLGNIVWTPSRVGSTVFELGYPDRTARKFRHGDDWWVGDIGPSKTAPSPIWSKYLEYPFEFPNGPTYVVGQSRWSTDWDFIQPTITDGSGNIDPSTGTITFNLASAPANGSTASLYIATASDYQGPLIISVNGNNLGSIATTATPNGESVNGYGPSYSGSGQESDASVREGIHGCFSDERLNFAGSYLKQGQNTITINMREGGYGANHAMYDYIRLELTGYVPPPPAGVNAYPGNNCNLICWPVTPGTTSYNVLRSTNSASGYASITNGVHGPVCGSGTNNDLWLDTTAINGTTYYYEVQSVNPTGTSASSPASPSATPAAGFSTNAPATPTGLTATATATLAAPDVGVVTLNWTPVPGANFYTVQRSTVVNNGDGTNVVLGTILLNNTNTTTTCLDTTPNSGSLYLYAVNAVSAGGASTNTLWVLAKPVPPPPAAPGGIAVVNSQTTTNQSNYITWAPSTGAVGYLVERTVNGGSATTMLQSVAVTNYTDSALPLGSIYSYNIIAMNEGGISSAYALSALTATPANGQITLNWSTALNATNYLVLRGTSSGNETNTVITTTNTSFIDTGLSNGTNYYYIVTAIDTGGSTYNSPEASATPEPTGSIALQDGSTTITEAAGTTVTLPVTVTTGAKALVVLVEDHGAPVDSEPATLSWNGVTLTLAIQEDHSATTTRGSAIYYCYNPPVNSAVTLSVTVPGADDVEATTFTLNGVNTAILPLAGGATSGTSGGADSLTFAVADVATNSWAAVNTTWASITTTPLTPTITATGGTANVTSASETVSAGSSEMSAGYVSGLSVGTDTFLASWGTAAVQKCNFCGLVFIPGTTVPPAAPTGLTATNAGFDQVGLAWNTSANTLVYAVKRALVSGGPYTVLAEIATTNYTDTSVAPGTSYYYVVTAINAAIASTNSTEADFTTPAIVYNLVWDGGTDTTNVWSFANNWAGNTGPINSFVANSITLAGTNNPGTAAAPLTNDLTGLTLTNLNFAANAASFYVTGNPLILVGGLNDYAAPTQTFNPNLTLSVPGGAAVFNVAAGSLNLGGTLSGSSGLAKTGLGSVKFGGASETFTGGLTGNAGLLTLDFSASNSPVANLIPATSALTLAGGTLQLTGSSNAASSQTFAATTLNAGESVISAAPVSGSNIPTITLGALTANAGAMVEFVGPPTIGTGNAQTVSNATLSTTASGNSAFVGGNLTADYDANFATVGLYDFAATTTTSPYTVIGGSQVSGFYTTANGTAPAGGTLDVTGDITGWASQPYMTAMRFNTSIGASIYVDSYTPVLTLSDILVTPNVGTYNVTFYNNVFRPAGGSSTSGGPFLVWQNNTLDELVLNTQVENPKTGTADYVQGGPGTVSITGTTSFYTGPSYLNGGVALLAGDGSIGAAATAATVYLNGGTLMANATFALDNGGVNLRPVTLLGNGGGLAAIAGTTLTVDGLVGSAATAGPLTIGLPGSAANGNVAGLLPGTGSGTANLTPVYATGTVVLTNANYYYGGTILQSGTLTINGINALGGTNYGGLTFNGGTLQYAPAFTGNGSGDLTAIGTAGITLVAGGGTIDVNGNNITYAGSIGNNGPGTLTVKSSLAGGSLTLSGANTYTGNTTITNVTLMVNNPTGSATGLGNVTVLNGGILNGTGFLAGAVTVTNGGTLTTSGSYGTLTINNNLTLSAGARTVLPAQHSPPANGSVTLSGTLFEGGTLIVTNLSVTALAAGDTFLLFNANNYTGSFSTLILPALSSGLTWYTNLLASAGVIAVINVPQPVIGSVMLTPTNVIISGNTGLPNADYYLLGSTNLTTPLTNWTRLLTNQFDDRGGFIFTNPLPPGAPQTFYLLQIP